MITTESKDRNWLLHLTTTAVVYGAAIFFMMPKEDRMYLLLKLSQAYRTFTWNQWLKHKPGWLVEAWQVRGKI